MKFNIQTTHSADYLKDIKGILQQAKEFAYSSVNSAMVQAYWLIGKRIVLEEQNGKSRADYGKQIIKKLAAELSSDYGKTYDERELRKIRQFYTLFPIGDSLSPESQDSDSQSNGKRDSVSPELNNRTIVVALFTRLSWTHIRHLLRVNNEEARCYYINETAANNWSTRTLDRNISTQYFQRLLASQIKAPVRDEMEKLTAHHQDHKLDFIKNPAVLEFLNLPTNLSYTEQSLEKALIDNLQTFIMELGKGYAFVERQQLVRTETSDFYIDLVFYNYILKCFVLLELKTDKLAHKDIGQLDMYVRMYDDLKRGEGDNPTIGILLCTETDKTIAKYSVLQENKQLFATKYLPYLPSEEELIAEIEREKQIIREQREEGNE